MKAHAIEKLDSEKDFIEVVNIDFDIRALVVTVIIDGSTLDVSFDAPVGFRVLDEGDLLEFWPVCSSPSGWLHEVSEGGWLEQESKRSGFLSEDRAGIKEYFVIGEDYCVNVIAWEAPSVTESIRC